MSSPANSLFATDVRQYVVGMARIADVLIVLAAGVLAYWLRHGSVDLPNLYLAATVLGALLTANFMHIARLYDFETLRNFVMQFGTMIAVWSAVAMGLLAIAYVTKYTDSFSRFWGLSWFGLTLVGFVSLRIFLVVMIRRWGRQGTLTINTVIIGAGTHGQKLVRHLRATRDPGHRLIAVFDNRKTRVPPEVEGVPVKGSVSDLVDFVRDNRVDEVIIALPWQAESHVTEILQELRSIAADVKMCPESIAFELPNFGYTESQGVPMLKIFERPLSGWLTFGKAVEDAVFSSTALILLSPIMLLVALAIRLESPGPVLFRQKRYGFNNNEFTVYKFRSMRAEDLAVASDADVRQASRDDPRVTRVGRFIRRTSLDELPQLFNVLKGEMSLVGPRPHAVAHNVKYAALIDEYLGRHRVKPGITGWAQVNGLRGETREPELMRRRVQHDLYYIENWSLLFDLKILLMTLFIGFIHRNAY